MVPDETINRQDQSCLHVNLPEAVYLWARKA